MKAFHFTETKVYVKFDPKDSNTHTLIILSLKPFTHIEIIYLKKLSTKF